MVIAHLYYDLYNLYGNDGNIKILVNKLKELEEDVELKNISVNDNLNFNEYDLIYMGSGLEEYQEIAIDNLKKYIEDIKNAIENNKMFLITGNAIDLFGKKIIGDKSIPTLGIFDYTSKMVPRIRKNIKYKADFLDNPILGYENHSCIIENNNSYLWEEEGIKYKNFYGTYVEGPVLVRNPEFIKYIISNLIKDKTKLDKIDLELENQAYNAFLNMY